MKKNIKVQRKILLSSEEYVSDIVITDYDINLIYKLNFKTVRIETIPLEDIESVTTIGYYNLADSQRYYTGSSTTKFFLKNDKVISFEEKPSIFVGCVYSFLLRMIDNKAYFPDFSYTLDCNNPYCEKEIDYYALHGKKMKYPVQTKVKVVLVIWAIFMIPVISLNMPAPKLTPNESEYMTKLKSGTQYRINRKCSAALRELNAAESIINNDYKLYIEKAYAYKCLKNPNETLIQCEKALQLLDSDNKSTYNKTHRFPKFISNNGGKVAIYTLMGETNYKLKNYEQSINNYTDVINLTSYKYTDAYFKRGRNKYYLGDKKGALSDFAMHKSKVLEYLEDQSNSEYRAKYPQYTPDSLDNINKWIQSARN